MRLTARVHTSVCMQGDQFLTATGKDGRVVYPVVKVSVEGVLCRALLDTAAGSSYASAALLDKLSKLALSCQRSSSNRNDAWSKYT